MTNINYTFVPCINDVKVLGTFTIDGKTYTVDWDGDHIGTMQIDIDGYEMLLKDDVLKNFVSIDEEDENIFIFDLGGIVYDPNGEYMQPEDIGSLFGVTTSEYGYGNG
jgi:hypothetical protein